MTSALKCKRDDFSSQLETVVCAAPIVLYAIAFVDRVHPEFGGIIGANGTDERNFVPFTSYGEAANEAERIQLRQATKIIEWKLV